MGLLSRRYQLFEFEDLTWFPTVIRNAMTDYLRLAIRIFRVYDPAVPVIERALTVLGKNEILDLCSGGGGGMPEVLSRLEEKRGVPIRVLLTDKFPNIQAFQEMRRLSGNRIEFVTDSIDATVVPEEYGGVRTLFSCFHHFPDSQAQAIIQSAVDRRIPICIFESTYRSYSMLIAMALAWLPILILMPLARPWKWSRFFWTYIIPVAPICGSWDGFASALRSRRPHELIAMAKNCRAFETYTWESREVSSKRGVPRMTYLLGLPSSATPQ